MINEAKRPSGRRAALCVGLVIVAAVLAGCGSIRFSEVKTHGVYTALGTPDLLSRSSVAMPSPDCVQRDTFGPGQTPVAVIAGYTGPVTLEVVEVPSGQSILSRDFSTVADRATLQSIHVSRSGDYEVRLLVGGNQQDAYRFKIDRPGPAGSAYSVRMRKDEDAESFQGYDPAVIAAVQSRWQQLLWDHSVNVVDGEVGLKCRLHPDGTVSDLKITGDTAGDDVGALCKKAVVDCAPYARWPDDLRQKVEGDYREMRFSFSLGN
jgi:hypothetical protein